MNWRWFSGAVVLIGASVALVLAGAIIWEMTHRQVAADPYLTMRLRINHESLFVEIPGTSELQAKGLGQRNALGADRGMMWKYEPDQDVTFWMKGMRFPLDFLWVKDEAVVAVTANVQPPHSITDTLTLLHSPGPVDRVIEVNAGYAAAHDISVGTTITEFDF